AALARGLLAAGQVAAARQLAEAVLRDAGGTVGVAARMRAARALCDAAEGVTPPATARARLAGPAVGFDRAEARLAGVELLLWEGQLGPAWTEAQQVETAAQAAGWRWLGCRARVLAAEAAYRLGHFSTAERAVRSVREEAEERGYGGAAARAGLLAAGLARTRGEAAEARRLLAAVAAAAGADGLRPEALVAHLGQVVLDGSPAPSYAPALCLARRFTLDEAPAVELRREVGSRFLTARHERELDPRRYELLVDLVGRQAKVGRRWVDFSGRKSVFAMLAALAARPGTSVPIADLARAAWQVEYHPLRHYARVTMAISRLRSALGPTVIDGGKEGYVLVPPQAWAVLLPLAAGGPELG
ncbi:MAG: hypothetical protein HY906_17985, partial [Deltaproteobacteria bacterium]|nr:hypothetical protein [Deltaproteobacteria bacterium]